MSRELLDMLVTINGLGKRSSSSPTKKSWSTATKSASSPSRTAASSATGSEAVTMKRLSNFFYLVSQGVKSVFKNAVMSVASLLTLLSPACWCSARSI